MINEGLVVRTGMERVLILADSGQKNAKTPKNGYWSRRIDDTNRIVYKVDNDTIIVVSCKGHYTD